MSMPLVEQVILLVIGTPPAGPWIIPEIRERNRNAGSRMLMPALVHRMSGCCNRAVRNAEQER
jgi:hypothetical protein